MRCNEKRAYATQAEAEAVRKEVVRKKFRGRALRRLASYPCPQCKLWHIGHEQQKPVQQQQPAQPQRKIPSTGELRRKLARIEREWDRQRLHKAAVIGKLIEAERQIAETENEMLEIQRQVTAMFLPAAR